MHRVMSSRYFVVALLFVACGSPQNPPAPSRPASPPTAVPPPSTPPTASAPNPLLPEWSGPYGGVPPFGRFSVSDIKPALETAMAKNLAEVERIANDPAPPNFDNTNAAMERAGKMLDRVGSIYHIYTSTMNDD